MTYSLYTSDPFTYPGGAIAAGVGVAVYFASTSVKAPIFHDDLGTTSKSNPVRTNGAGQVSFWIEPGSYDLVANGIRTNVSVAAIPAPPGPDDYTTRAEVEVMIAGSVAGVSSVNGRTGAVVLAKTDVGLGSVDNTSDATKFTNPALTGTATAESATLSKRLLISPDTITLNAGNADTDASLGNHFKISATANFTLTNPTNPSDGQRVMWQITQDATGSRTITLGSAFALGTDITAVVLSTAASKCDYLGAVYDSTTAKWQVVMFVRGY